MSKISLNFLGLGFFRFRMLLSCSMICILLMTVGKLNSVDLVTSERPGTPLETSSDHITDVIEYRQSILMKILDELKVLRKMNTTIETRNKVRIQNPK